MTEHSLFRPIDLNAPEVLIFLHIGKTAGGTFNDAVFNRFSPDERFHASRGRASSMGIHYLEDIEKFYIEEVVRRSRNNRIISGHIPFGMHSFIQKSSKYMSIIRDPVDRIVSSYYYNRRIDLSSAPIVREIVQTPLQELVQKRISPDFFNGQTRVLSGRQALDMPELTGGELNFPDVDDDDWRQVLENIAKRFIFIVPHEEIDYAICLFAEMYGFPLEAVATKPDNVTHDRPRGDDIPAEVRRIIEENNKYDILLHQTAKEIFGSIKEQIGDRLEDNVRKLRALRPKVT